MVNSFLYESLVARLLIVANSQGIIPIHCKVEFTLCWNQPMRFPAGTADAR